MGNGTFDVFAVHALIEINRRLEVVNHFVGGFIEASAPKFFAHIFDSLQNFESQSELQRFAVGGHQIFDTAP